jgi:glycosyltransferase involved in cell wall biosynthesis
MRIGFLGNSNNYPFRLAQALRALGHEVVFFVDRPRCEPRHRPEYHYTDVPYPYPDWICEIQPLSLKQIFLYRWTLRRVLRTLEACDGVVLNGVALSVGTLIRRPIIGLLTGSDLDVYANPNLVDTLAATHHPLDWLPGNGILKRMLFIRLVRLQRAGIARCCLVEYAIPGLLPDGDALLDEIGVDRKRRTSFMITDIEHLPSARARTDGAFRILCATRLQWKRPAAGSNVSPLDLKGTDAMLEGLRIFIARSHRPAKIRLISVGADAEAAERYVEELGLAPYVSWLPQLTQAEFLDEMAQADVVLENFGRDGCIGMAGRDAIAMGIPVIASGKSSIFERVLGEPLPIYEALAPAEICARLEEVGSNDENVGRKTMQARAFAERWFSARRAAKCSVAAFEEARKGSSER